MLNFCLKFSFFWDGEFFFEEKSFSDVLWKLIQRLYACNQQYVGIECSSGDKLNFVLFEAFTFEVDADILSMERQHLPYKILLFKGLGCQRDFDFKI